MTGIEVVMTRELEAMPRPILYIFAGLPGTGKTTLARKLAISRNAAYLRIDTVEQGLRDLCDFDVEGEGYRLSYRIANDNLQIGISVVADSCNPVELTRDEWQEVAARANSDFVNIEVVCSDPNEHRERVEGRESDIDGLHLPTWLDVEKRRFDSWSGSRVVVDTFGRTSEECFDELTSELEGSTSPTNLAAGDRSSMKTIGVLGGMSAASTQIYYSRLCQLVRDELGSFHSPDLLIRSLDFAPIEALQRSDNWEEAGRVLNVHAKTLEQAGAGLILLATNTMHKVAEEMMDGVNIPFLHIADTTAEAIRSAGLERPGLMATAFTMEQSFYTDRLRSAGLEAIIPEADDRRETHRIIYEELCQGVVARESRNAYVKIADRLVSRGADCLILGCTEIGMLLNADNVAVPVFDTTQIHCESAVRWSLLG